MTLTQIICSIWATCFFVSMFGNMDVFKAAVQSESDKRFLVWIFSVCSHILTLIIISIFFGPLYSLIEIIDFFFMQKFNYKLFRGLFYSTIFSAIIVAVIYTLIKIL